MESLEVEPTHAFAYPRKPRFASVPYGSPCLGMDKLMLPNPKYVLPPSLISPHSMFRKNHAYKSTSRPGPKPKPPQMSSTPIPLFYQISFQILDPILSLSGILLNLFSPLTIVKSYNPKPHLPPSLETILLLQITAGFLTGLVLLQLILLRLRPRDLVVWKAVQGSMLIVDLFMLGGFCLALEKQGRLGVQEWRSEEWVNIGVTGWVAVVRSGFILGLGLGGKGKVERKTR